MSNERRHTLRIGPLAPPREEHCTAAECRKDFTQMLKDALKG